MNYRKKKKLKVLNQNKTKLKKENKNLSILKRTNRQVQTVEKEICLIIRIDFLKYYQY
jgi:hypothetical protein